ncbi:MAG: hypothetical protein LBJ82_05755, partial [Deltaproteobacteria bacterium]|jgi:hypothetical protein|nr:hypothetical protein [Deltaproteobacteria bacterium]
MNLCADFCRRLERWLYGLGFTAALPRRLLAFQLLLGGAGLLFGLPLAGYSLWPLAFGLGALIMAGCLWQTIRFAHLAQQQSYSTRMGARFFARFLVRFFCIGLILYPCIVILRAPLAPLLLGLASTSAAIALWGIARLVFKTAKEA